MEKSTHTSREPKSNDDAVGQPNDSTVNQSVDLTDLPRIEAEIDSLLGKESGKRLVESLAHQAAEPKFGKYVIRQILCEKGQSFVLLAFDPDLGRTVVLKIYDTELSSEYRERIYREGQLLSKISSDLVVDCYAMEEIDGFPCLILEYISGVTLDQYAAERPLQQPEIIRLIREITEGVAEIHKVGCLHCDLKPGNVLVTRAGNARIIDLGLSQSFSETRPGEIAGTPAFIAPERAHMEIDQVDVRSDIFGIGGILYFLLYGSAPFAASTKQGSIGKAQRGSVNFPDSTVVPCDAGLRAVCKKCLAPAPIDRFENSAELLADLRRAEQTESGHERPKSSINLLVAGVMSVVAIIVLGIVAYSNDWFASGFGRQPEAEFEDRQPAKGVSEQLEEKIGKRLMDDGIESFQLIEDFELEFKVLRDVNGQLVLVEPDGNGVIPLEMDQEYYICLNPGEVCYAGIFSLEYNADEMDAKCLYPIDEFYDSPRLTPVSKRVETLNPSDSPNFFKITTSSMPNKIEHFLVYASTQRWAPKEIGPKELEDVVRGVERHPNGDVREATILLNYQVYPNAQEKSQQLADPENQAGE